MKFVIILTTWDIGYLGGLFLLCGINIFLVIWDLIASTT